MAVIELTEISSFENNIKSQSLTKRINNISITTVYKNNYYAPALVLTDEHNPSIILFEMCGQFYDTPPTKEIKNLQSFKDLGIQTIDGNNTYLPTLSKIDSTSSSKIYVIDSKYNTTNASQHIARYDHIYSSNHPAGKDTFSLEDAIVFLDNQDLKHFAVSESRYYDAAYGGYPLTFYSINDQGKVLEFDTKNYKNRIFANPQSLVWKPTGQDNKQGFVRLNENSYYWGNREELIYAFGIEDTPAGKKFALEVVNLATLLSGQPSSYYGQSFIQNNIKLGFNGYVDFNLPTLPKFDSATCLDDKEFIIAMIPVVNDKLDSSYRDLYWFRLKSNKDEAILLADPYRIANIDRFDTHSGVEGTISLKYFKDPKTSEEIIYLLTGQNDAKKFRIDLLP
ncbi:hypothetical protein FJZ53_05020 [Candidatus Woesearchaeota archaeon]|nr:hypothetical protein [Candidatus Woesearchaeota archaeon]